MSWADGLTGTLTTARALKRVLASSITDKCHVALNAVFNGHACLIK